jgi:hypothetical protein
MFAIRRARNWCLKKNTSTQTTTAAIASAYNTPANRVLIDPIYGSQAPVDDSAAGEAPKNGLPLR